MYGKKKERITEKNSYERRAYESVDDRSLLGYISKINGKQNSGSNGLENFPRLGSEPIRSRLAF